jgi:hypothetical protein
MILLDWTLDIVKSLAIHALQSTSLPLLNLLGYSLARLTLISRFTYTHLGDYSNVSKQ